MSGTNLPRTGTAERFRPLDGDELDEAVGRAVAAFGDGDRDAVAARLRTRIDAGELWGLERAGAIRGHCRLLFSEHWFGGTRVPCIDIAAVAVPPEHRGSGVARAMMHATLRVGAERGSGLSTLFPATTAFYRRLGWELAGTFASYRVDARHTPAGGPPLRPAGAADWSAIRDCATRFAAARNGIAVRREDDWRRLREAAFAYVHDGDDRQLDAYVLLDHRDNPGDWRHTLQVRDWAATSAAGLRALVGFIGSHGTLAKDAVLRDGDPPLLAMVAEEQDDVQRRGGFSWMARGVDVASALAARGYPAGLSGAVTLAVDDPLLPSGRGSWRLSVHDGRGTVTTAERADVRLDARAFGPLFTGFRAPDELRLLGLCEGDPDALAWLAAAFAGSPPLQLDFF